MPAAANGNRHLIVPAKVNRVDHVCDILTAGYESRALVDHAVVDFTRFIVAGIAWLYQFALQLSGESSDGLFGNF